MSVYGDSHEGGAFPFAWLIHPEIDQTKVLRTYDPVRVNKREQDGQMRVEIIKIGVAESHILGENGSRAVKTVDGNFVIFKMRLLLL